MQPHNAQDDITGQHFGDWIVLGFGESDGKHRLWKCQCICGVIRFIPTSRLRIGASKGCGCARNERTRQRLSTQPVEQHPGWKGGRLITGDGYILVRHGLEHQHKGWRKSYKLEHILVMEIRLGRKLLPGETVHHKNGIRSDNRDDNLELWASSHPAGQRISDLVEWAEEILARYKLVVDISGSTC